MTRRSLGRGRLVGVVRCLRISSCASFAFDDSFPIGLFAVILVPSRFRPSVLFQSLVASFFVSAASLFAASSPQADRNLVFAEQNGIVAVEAEHFHDQTLTDVRGWYLVHSDSEPVEGQDGDPPHVAGASGGAYLEILPDTRRTHDDRLIRGTNFSPQPGKMAVLSYKVKFQTPGRYYVWVRAYSTGSEDNGLHVGIDGTWPESGQRLQWCAGKRTWRWESKQRTEAEHCGEPHKIYLDVKEAGEHVISFSMREDGFEFDKWLMTQDRAFERPDGLGPDTQIASGQLPKAFAFQRPPFPEHWGEPPRIQTRDLRPLPGGYGQGSSTLARWIQENLDRDAANAQQENTSSSPTRPVSDKPRIEPRQPDGDGQVMVVGALKQWHNTQLDLFGPYAHEQDNDPNPFTDYRMTVTFEHQDGTEWTVPGYFAADGDAANSSAESGTRWRAHFAAPLTGRWSYRISFTQGERAALDETAARSPVAPYDGKTGSFEISSSDKQGRDLRAHGLLQYVGRHYLQFASSKKYFLKVGADAPETLLAFADFDNTVANQPKKAPLKSWEPHVKDWREGDPVWQNDKGKGLIGAINYLSAKGCNAFSFLTYNAGGDGDNVWPFIHRDDKLHYDCSKLDQWGIVFAHGTAQGMYLHFKMQETENDDHNKGGTKTVPESLDGGNLGTQRKLYCRELVARFGHNLALNWNLGEENTQSTEQQQAMINYLEQLDAYKHPIVVHTYPDQQDKVYRPLLGDRSKLAGTSLQNSSLTTTHTQTVKWVKASAEAGKPWVVAFDESGSAAHGQCPDLGYRGFDGHDQSGKMIYTQHAVRKQTLWGHLMGGGAGCEYYFGYQFVENDLKCEDWRSRDQSWDYCRIAIDFFHNNKVPFWEMVNSDELVGNARHEFGNFCFAKPDEIYLVYLPNGGSTPLDLTNAKGQFTVQWFNPRDGGPLQQGSVTSVAGGSEVELGNPPSANDDREPERLDWLAVIRKVQ